MAGEEYTTTRGLGEDYREVNNRRGREERQGGGEDYREVTREKMRFLRTLTVSCYSFSSLIILHKTKCVKLTLFENVRLLQALVQTGVPPSPLWPHTLSGASGDNPHF